MNISKIIQDAVGNKIGEQFGFSAGKVESIIETISDSISGSGDTSSVLSGLGNMLSGESAKEDVGSNIKSALTNKENLSSDTAAKIKDLVLPLVLDFIKNKAGDKIGGMFKF